MSGRPGPVDTVSQTATECIASLAYPDVEIQVTVSYRLNVEADRRDSSDYLANLCNVEFSLRFNQCLRPTLSL